MSRDILRVDRTVTWPDLEGRLVEGDFFEIARYFPSAFVDLLILDPPYNLSKNFNGSRFRKRARDDYRSWFVNLIDRLVPMMKPQATLYVCSDWTTSTLIFPILDARLQVRNRITWEREKGPRSEDELEEQYGIHLVLYHGGRLLFRRRCGETEA